MRELDSTDSRLLDDEETVQMILPTSRADYTAVGEIIVRPTVQG